MGEIKRFLKEEAANGVVEVILILVVLIAMVTLFRDKLKTLLTKLMEKVSKNANAV